MASPVNSQLKFFVYFLVVATFSFFLMFFSSPKNAVLKIYDRKLTRPSLFSITNDTEPCTGQGLECLGDFVLRQGLVTPGGQVDITNEFSNSKSLNDSRADAVRIHELAPTRNPKVLLSETSSQHWWNAMLKRQTERKLHLRRMCETKYNQSVLPLKEFVKDNKRLYSFYYVDKYKLIYSFVHKVGSSNWARMLNSATENNPLKRLYLLPQRQALWRLQKYTSFIIVRHPLVRLLSAYKDKFVEHHIPHFKSIGRYILKKYRKGATRAELERADNVRFIEFLKYLVADKRNRGNTHWDNLIIRNRVCLFNYDIIAKLETGDEDTEFIFKTFHLEGLVNLGSHYTNYTGKQDTLRSFYSEIPSNLLKSVIDAYESDFLLFNYSMNVP